MDLTAMDKEAEAFRKYIATRKVLIADESSSTRSGLFNVLTSLGAKPDNIGLASTIHEADSDIAARKPDLVLAGYDFGRSCGLELIQTQRAQNPESKKTIFMILASNTSQTAVARAAEEDVDGFLLKPFTPEVLRRTIIRLAIVKINPPPYVKMIEEGKEILAKGDCDGAEKIFRAALDLDPKPSLAWFYIGQTAFLRKVVDQAKGDYEHGLDFNKIHYKCMVGLYELLMDLKQYSKAYEVVKRLSQYFPANPKRLTEVLRLAIMNKQYEDVEKYYATFCNLDSRHEVLINYVCAALVVCGKYYLQTNNRSRALELFQKAAVTSAGRVKIIREIVLSLVDLRLGSESAKFLERYPLDQRSNQEFALLEFQVANVTATQASQIVTRGKALLDQGIADLNLYEVMITRCIEIQSLSMAENLVDLGASKYPDQRNKLEALIKGTAKLA